MHHAATAKVLGSSANVTITPVHPLAELCKLIAILLTHNPCWDIKPAVPDGRALLTFGHHEAVCRARRLCLWAFRIISVSAFRRHNLTTNFAVWIGLCMNVDVPLARRQLLGLFWSECRLPLDRASNRSPLFG
jgi:hypothetical protein